MSHATYRYVAADILTNDIIADLPFYGVHLTKEVSVAGTFTGTFRLGTGRHNDGELLEATIPGKTCVYVLRDDEYIWGGPVWQRTYASDAKTLQVNAQTFESVFNHIIFNGDLIKQDVEQVTIFQDIITQMEAQPGCDFNFVLEMPAASGQTRTILLPNYQFHTIADALRELVGVFNGLEYVIGILPGVGTEEPIRRLRVGYPKLSPGNSYGYDYPGTVSNYWWPESASTGGVFAAVLGAGSGNKVLRAKAKGQAYAGYPSWTTVHSYPSLGTIKAVQLQAKKDAEMYGIPVLTPTFELSDASDFESWNSLGDDIQISITDARFPDTTTFTRRVMGFEISPGSDADGERVKLVLEGGEE